MSVPISPDIEERIVALHRPEDYEAVRAMLLEYGTKSFQTEIDRVRYDILYLAAGDVAKVRSLVDLAHLDQRDVMVQEYRWDEGISKPREWAMVHEVNRKLRARIDVGEVKPRQPIARRDWSGSSEV